MRSFGVRHWGGWAPGLPGREDWENWLEGSVPDFSALEGEAAPESDRVPSRTWRRCSHVTRMGLIAAFRCCQSATVDPQEVQLVWMTRHGEIELTLSLLSDLVRGELVSPMGFANSVPNTAAAYFGIVTDNTLPARTLCSPPPVFPRGCLDALGMLAKRPDNPVLLIHADAGLPDPLGSLKGPDERSFGVAFLMGAPGDEPIEFDRRPGTGKPARPASTEPLAPAFLHWLESGATRFERGTGTERWIWLRP